MAASQPSKYLQYLPAIFQRRPAGGDEPILGQFLAPFEKQFNTLEQILAEVDNTLSASQAPADDFLPWLAGWVAHLFDEEWDEDRRRRFLAGAMELYRWRGTSAGLKRYLDLCLDLGPGEVEIREGRWPGGMQVGVASRIGYAAGPAAAGGAADGSPGDATQGDIIGQIAHDYYIVETVAPTGPEPRASGSPGPDPVDAGGLREGLPGGERIQIYYDAEFIRRIDLLKDSEGRPAGVRLSYLKRDATGKERTLHQFTHPPPEDLREANKINVVRRDGLIDYHFSPTDKALTVIAGGTLLVSDLERPYRFIVDICRTFPEPAKTKQTEAEKAKAVRTEIEKLGRKVRALLDAEKPAHTEYAVRITPAAGRPGPNFMQIGEYSSIGLDTTVA